MRMGSIKFDMINSNINAAAAGGGGGDASSVPPITPVKLEVNPITGKQFVNVRVSRL